MLGQKTVHIEDQSGWNAKPLYLNLSQDDLALKQAASMSILIRPRVPNISVTTELTPAIALL